MPERLYPDLSVFATKAVECSNRTNHLRKPNISFINSSMTQEIPPQEALRLPGNEPSFPQQSDKQMQQTSWNANLEEDPQKLSNRDSQNANASLALHKEQMFARDSNEAYNLQG